MSDPNLTPVAVVPTATIRGLLAEAIHTEASLTERRAGACEDALEFATLVRVTLERVIA